MPWDTGVSSQGRWIAAVLACGDGRGSAATRSAAVLWESAAGRARWPVDVSVPTAADRAAPVEGASACIAAASLVPGMGRQAAFARRASWHSGHDAGPHDRRPAPRVSSRQSSRSGGRSGRRRSLGLPIGERVGHGRGRAATWSEDFLATSVADIACLARGQRPGGPLDRRLPLAAPPLVGRNRRLRLPPRASIAFEDDRERDLDLRGLGYDVSPPLRKADRRRSAAPRRRLLAAALGG